MLRRSRIAHFKTPFVISVAAPAALGIACGGRTDVLDGLGGAGSSSVSNGGSSAGGSGGSSAGTGGGSATCSGSTRPASSCYEPVCVDGHWELSGGGCNPPAIREDCPASEPLSGTSCADYARDHSCSYDYCSGTTPTRCCNGSTGLWEALPLPTCNPPAPASICPEQMPMAGSDCSSEAQECRYDGCQGPDSSVAICSFGQWTTAYSSSASCNPPPIQPVCPTRELSAGEGCAFEGQTCSNQRCTSDSRDGFVCSAGAWRATVLPCQTDAGGYPGF